MVLGHALDVASVQVDVNNVVVEGHEVPALAVVASACILLQEAGALEVDGASLVIEPQL